MRRRAPNPSLDTKMAEFQRFRFRTPARPTSATSPNRKIRLFLAVGAGKTRVLRIFCIMRKGAVRNPWHGKRTMRIPDRSCGFSAGRADSCPTVRIFEDSCGFIIGIFRQIVSKSAVFSPKRPFSAGSRSRAIRTTCRKSAHTIQNPHTSPKIRRVLQESALSSENPHNLSRIRTTCRKSAILVFALQRILDRFRIRILVVLKIRPCLF